MPLVQVLQQRDGARGPVFGCFGLYAAVTLIRTRFWGFGSFLPFDQRRPYQPARIQEAQSFAAGPG